MIRVRFTLRTCTRSLRIGLHGCVSRCVMSIVMFAITVTAAADARLGLPALTRAESSRNSAIAELGERLFFDQRLSADGRVSCAQCHEPRKAFTDGLPIARGIANRNGTRNTPSLWNVAYERSLF